ncbi:peroxisomal carnitine O-octanoyltransferase-like [Lingula anatina]|uniref:Peroxisomal carnitine O-octanoyltransferase n=1 Tax=Lingula anatina TaxID=7574 RepID=A0A1S3J9W8_LINAN|nr:peroxisomal carnitine O-octanoyltransferase-like [Lingula anatina]XP_013407005.1 peroxisomal carnitine O-octanoyltransferase-like [Lingula anatina]XP_013407006.1 peroxisomal carnitine O-octanoyltransferase-like [Lingula anatina]|eukprot:XP_013407004.1 peroxisomal carnitine O-octanoyltransferase-like [Lingula anatina]
MTSPLQMYVSEKERTFDCEDSLPNLPIPPLEQTLKKYLDSVRPHLSPEELRTTEFIVQEFGQGVGKELHRRLLDNAKHKRNWLEKWWEEYAYLRGRYPSSPIVNFAGPGPYSFKFWPPKEGTQVPRCAITTYYTLKYWQMLRRERLSIDRNSKRQPLSMSQFHRGFSTCKIPGEEVDHFNFYFKTKREGKTPTHFLVICKGRIFTVDGVDEKEEPYTPPELEAQLQLIREKCDSEPRGPGVGALTGAERTDWAKLRQHLLELSPCNVRSLDIIQTSMFVVSLDDVPASDFTEMMQHSLCGDCTNRWYDKSLCFITFSNGTSGCNCDHAPFDAMVMVSLTYFIDLNVTECKGKWQGSKEVRIMKPPEELTFLLDGDIYHGIAKAIETHDKLAKNVECFSPIFTGYGRKYLRSHKISPDTHVQLALQLAYYRMHKKPAPTYETATTRRYYHGRTETVRSCTMEALTWCKAMMDPQRSVLDRLKLYRIASQKHAKMMVECQNNSGCDRHLLGLYLTSLEAGMSVPIIFTDPAWTKSGGGGNYILSTSFVGYTTVHGGVAPMCKDGYGVFYRFGPDCIVFFMSSWISDESTSARELYENLRQSLLDMKHMVESPEAQAARL